ncbi:hypothetical protein VTI74DRAFT_8696 [Chaetomium olivicolor]
MILDFFHYGDSLSGAHDHDEGWALRGWAAFWVFVSHDCYIFACPLWRVVLPCVFYRFNSSSIALLFQLSQDSLDYFACEHPRHQQVEQAKPEWQPLLCHSYLTHAAPVHLHSPSAEGPSLSPHSSGTCEKRNHARNSPVDRRCNTSPDQSDCSWTRRSLPGLHSRCTLSGTRCERGFVGGS